MKPSRDFSTLPPTSLMTSRRAVTQPKLYHLGQVLETDLRSWRRRKRGVVYQLRGPGKEMLETLGDCFVKEAG